MSSTTTNKVLTTPDPSTKVGPIYNYTDEQKTHLENLKEVRKQIHTVLRLFLTCSQYAFSLLLPESDSYHFWEKRWLNKPDTMTRYMRSAKWNFADAQKRIKATIEWRREFKPDIIPPDEVQIESETGKMCVVVAIGVTRADSGSIVS